MTGLDELVSILQLTLLPDQARINLQAKHEFIDNQAGLDFAAHWLETHTGPHLVGGLLAVLLEEQLETGVGHFFHILFLFSNR